MRLAAVAGDAEARRMKIAEKEMLTTPARAARCVMDSSR